MIGAFSQLGSDDWFIEETDCSGRQGPLLVGLFRKSRDENQWYCRGAPPQMALELQARHARHVDVGDDTGRGFYVRRLEEVISRRECMHGVSDLTSVRIPLRTDTSSSMIEITGI